MSSDDIHTEPEDEDRKALEDAGERYLTAMHGVQTGLVMLLARDPALGSPKSLRVGVNSAMISEQAVAKLLIERGVFTEMEYTTMVADCAEEARDQIAAQLTRDAGGGEDSPDTKTTLH